MHYYKSLQAFIDKYCPHTTALTLSLILATGFVLRLWNIAFGLPYLYHPDEPMVAIVAVRMYKTCSLNPCFFHYPSLWLYINMFSYYPLMYIGKMLGYYSSLKDISPPFMLAMGCGKIDTPEIMLIGKFITAILGTATIWFVYKIGRIIGSGVLTGLFAAAMVAVSPTNVEYSRYMTTDTILVFFIVLSLYFAQNIFKHGHMRYYLMSGLCAGLAASSKYNGAIAACGFVAAHFLRTGFTGLKDYRVYLAVLVSAAAFFITTPYSFLAFDKFYEGLRFDATHYASGHEGMEKNVVQWYITYLFHYEGVIILLSAIGLLLAFIKRHKLALIPAGFIVLYCVFVSMFTIRNARTIMPAIPLLIVMGAWCVSSGYNFLRRKNQLASACLICILMACALYFPAAKSLRFVYRLGCIDSRETARVWIEDNIPLKSKIALEGYSPYIDKNKYVLKGLNRIIDHPPAYYVANKFDYLVFSQGMYGRFFIDPKQYSLQISRYNLFFTSFEHIKTFNDGNYEVKIYKTPATMP